MQKFFWGIFYLLMTLPGCVLSKEAPTPSVEQKSSWIIQNGVVLDVREIYGQSRQGAVPGLQDVDILEITVLLEDGEKTLVRREADDFFKKGDRIRLLHGIGGQIRIQHE